MASTRLDFPDPVGPVRAKTSAPSKSTTAGSRNDVNPSSSSRLGRMGVLQQVGKQRHQPGVVDGLLGQVLAEELLGRAAGAGRTLVHAGGPVARWGHDHVD